jgi:U3 small nucleolar RNA-associated protein 10
VIKGELSITDVNNTLIQLAVATNDLNRWQHLIELLSFRSNHPNRIVRLHVLSTLEAAANELSKDFLSLLPPAVPFLAELMNDDDAEVESEAQKLILKLEEIVGEPLQPYFAT